MTSSTNFPGPVKVQGRYVPTLSADGRALVDAAGNTVRLNQAPSTSTGLPVVVSPSAASTILVARATVTDVQRRAPNGQMLRGVRITADGTTPTAIVDFAIAIPSTHALGRHNALFYSDPPSTGKSVDLSLYLGADSAFATSFLYGTPTQKFSQPGWFSRAPGKDAGAATKWTVAGGSPVFGTTTFTHLRVRLNISSNGDMPWIEFYGMEYAADPAASAFVLTVDDGYDNNYTIGAPTFEKYGMRGSFGIIANKIGTAGYMTWAQLQDLRDRGHECVVHGCRDDVANLSLLPNSDAILSEVKYQRQALIDNGLNVNGSANVYVYPQGIFETVARDTTIRNALAAAGFVGGRAANQTLADQGRNRYGVDPWQVNVIGHSWVSDPSEAANITTLQGSINAGANDRRDVVLMLHKFVTAAAANSLEIRQSNLELLLASAAANVSAGTQKNMLLSELVYSMAAR